jgi:hypothetical protein
MSRHLTDVNIGVFYWFIFPFRPLGLIRQGTHPVTEGSVFEDTAHITN